MSWGDGVQAKEGYCRLVWWGAGGQCSKWRNLGLFGAGSQHLASRVAVALWQVDAGGQTPFLLFRKPGAFQPWGQHSWQRNSWAGRHLWFWCFLYKEVNSLLVHHFISGLLFVYLNFLFYTKSSRQYELICIFLFFTLTPYTKNHCILLHRVSLLFFNLYKALLYGLYFCILTVSDICNHK